MANVEIGKCYRLEQKNDIQYLKIVSLNESWFGADCVRRGGTCFCLYKRPISFSNSLCEEMIEISETEYLKVKKLLTTCEAAFVAADKKMHSKTF